MVSSKEKAGRAFLFVLLFWATANALSYFARSDGWGNLLGQTPTHSEAIGFPWLIWAAGGIASTGYYSRLALVGNVAVTLLTAAIAYGLVVRLARRSHDSSHSYPNTPPQKPGRALQFRLRTLLGLVAVEAIVLGGIRAYGDARPALLAAVYLCGPVVLLAVAWRLRDVIPAHRNVALLVVGFVFVPAAAVLGESIEGLRDFTRGLLGLFVCWVPQCVLLAVGISVIQRCFSRRENSLARRANGDTC